MGRVSVGGGMKGIAICIIVAVLLSGCKSEPSVSGYDLHAAYNRCVWPDEEDSAIRIACTQAVYGGMP